MKSTPVGLRSRRPLAGSDGNESDGRRDREVGRRDDVTEIKDPEVCRIY
jgi:hypothetical protein